jgi:DNA anti-recombination protein RmuC
MTTGNGKAVDEVGHFCRRGERIRDLEDQHSNISEELIKLSNRIGAILPDGAASPHSLTSLVMDLGARMVSLNHRLNSIAPKIEEIEEERETTQIQTRAELVNRAHRVERELEEVKKQQQIDVAIRSKAETAKTRKMVYSIAIGLALVASGAGGSEIVKLVMGFLVR